MRSVIVWLMAVVFTLAASSDKTRLQNEAVVQAAVEGIKEHLPQKVDAFTTMVDVEGNGTTLIYLFDVDAGPKSDAQLIAEGKERMRRQVTRGVCQTSQRFLKSGITLIYRYRSAASGHKLFDVQITRKDCPKLD